MKNPSSWRDCVLNGQGCCIKTVEGKGRNVYGAQSQFFEHTLKADHMSWQHLVLYQHTP